MIYILQKNIENEIFISNTYDKWDISHLPEKIPTYARKMFECIEKSKIKFILYDINNLYFGVYNDNNFPIDNRYLSLTRIGMYFFPTDTNSFANIESKIHKYKQDQRDMKINNIFR